MAKVRELMSLDTHGFFNDCQCCIDHGLKKMDNHPMSTKGKAEAKESFGDLWDKYRECYLFNAKHYNTKNPR